MARTYQDVVALVDVHFSAIIVMVRNSLNRAPKIYMIIITLLDISKFYLLGCFADAILYIFSNS